MSALPYPKKSVIIGIFVQVPMMNYSRLVAAFIGYPLVGEKFQSGPSDAIDTSSCSYEYCKAVTTALYELYKAAYDKSGHTSFALLSVEAGRDTNGTLAVRKRTK